MTAAAALLMLWPRRPRIQRPVGLAGSCGWRRIGARVLRVRGAGRDVDPLLGGLLHRPVERRDDLVAAGVDLRAVVRGVRAEHLGRARGGPATRSAAPSSRPRPAGAARPARSWPPRTRRRCACSPVSVLRVFIRSRTWLRRWTISRVLRHDELEVRALLAFGDVRRGRSPRRSGRGRTWSATAGWRRGCASWARVRSASDLPK